METQAKVREARDRVARVRRRLTAPDRDGVARSIEDLEAAGQLMAGVEQSLRELPPHGANRQRMLHHLDALASEIRHTGILLASAVQWIAVRETLRPANELSYGPGGQTASVPQQQGGIVYG